MKLPISFQITDVIFLERLILMCFCGWRSSSCIGPPCVECGRYLLPVRVTNPVPHSPLWEATDVWLFRLSIMYRTPQLITVFTCFHRWFLSWARIIRSKLLANCCFNTHINIVLPCVSCVIALLVSRPKFCMNSCFRHAICIPCLRHFWLYW